MRLEKFAYVPIEALRHQISWDRHIKEDEMGEACGMPEGEKKDLQYFGRKSRRNRLIWMLRRSYEGKVRRDRTVIVWEDVYRIHLD